MDKAQRFESKYLKGQKINFSKEIIQIVNLIFRAKK